jgi:hypothetical protein
MEKSASDSAHCGIDRGRSRNDFVGKEFSFYAPKMDAMTDRTTATGFD